MNVMYIDNNPFIEFGKTYAHKRSLGQLTVVGILLIFLSLMVMKSLMGSVIDATNSMYTDLNTTQNNTSYPEAAVLVSQIPLFLVVVLLATIALYGAPQP